MVGKISTLRPGYMVGLSTKLRGNVSYHTVMLEDEHVNENGEAEARWETQRVKRDAEEDTWAKKVRSLARNKVVRVCAPSEFGLLCPENRLADLEAGIAEGQRIVDDFNAKARFTRLGFYVMLGRVAEDDAKAVKAINSEVRELLDAMNEGIKTVDVKAIRFAADKAKELSQMLSPSASEAVQNAVKIARAEAVKIVRAGETATAVIDQAALARLTETKLSFLDLEEGEEVKAPEATGLSLDLMPVDEE
jgi:hypothetical protein